MPPRISTSLEQVPLLFVKIINKRHPRISAAPKAPKTKKKKKFFEKKRFLFSGYLKLLIETKSMELIIERVEEIVIKVNYGINIAMFIK